MNAFILDFGHERPQASFSTFTSSSTFKFSPGASPSSATPSHQPNLNPAHPSSNRNSTQPHQPPNTHPSNNNDQASTTGSVGARAAADAALAAAQALSAAQKLEDFTSLKDRWLEARVEAFREEFEELERGYHGYVVLFDFVLLHLHPYLWFSRSRCVVDAA